MRGKQNTLFVIKRILFLYAACVVCCGAYAAGVPRTMVTFGDYAINAELAVTESEQQQGLMYRRSMPDKCGMLFVFAQEAEYEFWMKNTYIPLDIIWLRADKTVAYMYQNAQPCKGQCPVLKPRGKALYVLEVNAGTCAAIGLRPGDAMAFDIPATTAAQ